MDLRPRLERIAATFGDRCAGRGPDGVKGTEQRDPGRQIAFKQGPIRQDRLQRGHRIAVSGALAARQCAGIAAQEGKLRPDRRSDVRRFPVCHVISDNFLVLMGTKRSRTSFVPARVKKNTAWKQHEIQRT